MLLIGLLAFLLMAVALLSCIRPKWARWATAVVLDVFFCAQLSSVYIGRSFIDYKYYQHLKVETLAMASAFKVEAGLMVLLAVGLPF